MELQRFYKKVKLFKLTYFLVKYTNYKAIQILYGMELQRVYKTVKLFKLTYFLMKYTNYMAIQPLCGMEFLPEGNISRELHCPRSHTHLKQQLF